MGSSRLPGKVMEDLGGESMLGRVVRRVGRVRKLDRVIVATSDRADDDVIARLCLSRGWGCFRGDEVDVLDRYYRAAREEQADVVVRITADCPLIDPAIIDWVVQKFVAAFPEVDYLSNIFPKRMFPRGLDTEVLSFKALEKSWRRCTDPAEREHVTLYIRHNPALFKIDEVTSERDYSSFRWTVDTPEDLEFARQVYAHFSDDDFSWEEALAAVMAHPEWQEINREVKQKII